MIDVHELHELPVSVFSDALAYTTMHVMRIVKNQSNIYLRYSFPFTMVQRSEIIQVGNGLHIFCQLDQFFVLFSILEGMSVLINL